MTGSWRELGTILEDFQDRVYRQPTHYSCPYDGQPLLEGPDEQPYCPFDGYRPGQVNDPGYGPVTS